MLPITGEQKISKSVELALSKLLWPFKTMKKDEEKVLEINVKALLLSYFSILLSEMIISCL